MNCKNKKLWQCMPYLLKYLTYVDKTSFSIFSQQLKNIIMYFLSVKWENSDAIKMKTCCVHFSCIVAEQRATQLLSMLS